MEVDHNFGAVPEYFDFSWETSTVNPLHTMQTTGAQLSMLGPFLLLLAPLPPRNS